MAHPRRGGEAGEPREGKKGLRRVGLYAGLLFAWLAVVLYVRVGLALVGFLANRWGSPTIDQSPLAPPLTAAAWDLALVIAFAVPHSLLIRPSGQRLLCRLVPDALVRSVYVLLAALSLSLVLHLWRPIDAVVWAVPSGWATSALWVIFVAGWLLALAASRSVGHYRLFGLAQAWDALKERQAPAPRLETGGLYRWSRHPMYLGFVIASWATPVMTAGHLLFAVAMTVYVAVGAYLEERDLVAAFGQEYRDYREATGWWGPRWLGGLGLAALAVLLFQVPAESSQRERAWRNVRGLAGGRPLEARLVELPSHGPWRHRAEREPMSPIVADALERGAAAEDLSEMLGALKPSPREADPARWHSYGVARLVTASSEPDVDGAIASLEHARELAPDDARICSDLAAALSTRDQPEDLARALEAVLEALELEPSLSPALYNRALLLSRLSSSSSSAVHAWDAYLERETDPAWLAEGRDRRDRLPTASPREQLLATDPLELVARGRADELERQAGLHPQAASDWGEDDLPLEWARRVLARDAGNPRDVQEALRAISRALPANSFPAALAGELESLFADRREAAATTILRYGEARDLYFERRFRDAYPRLQKVERDLSTAVPSLALWAQFFLRACEFGSDNEASIPLFEALAEEAGRRGYPKLAGHAELMQGIALLELGRSNEALDIFSLARDRFERAGLLGDLAYMDSSLADAHRRLGPQVLQWRALRNAAMWAGEVRNPRWQTSIWIGVAKGASELELHRTAVVLADEAARAAEAAPERWESVRAMVAIERAALFARAGREGEAEADVQSALHHLELLGEGNPSAVRLRAQLFGVAGQFDLNVPGLDSEQALGEAIEYQRRQKGEVVLPWHHLALARLLRERGEEAEALAQLEIAIEVFERQPFDAESPWDRADFLGMALRLFDPLIAWNSERDPSGRGALAAIDRFLSLRGSRFCRRCGEGREDALALLEAPGALAPDAALLVLWSVEKRSFAWLLDAGGIEQEELTLSREAIRENLRAVERFLYERRESAAGKTALKRLHAGLLAPFGARLAGKSSLYVLADSRLGSLPVDALIDEETGEAVFESLAVQGIPDAAPLRALAPMTSTPMPSRSLGAGALLVGDPAFDTALYPGLARLEHSRAEALEVGKLYEEAMVWTGEQASKPAVLERLPGVEQFIFAGHALPARSSDRSAGLVLAASPAHRGDSESAILSPRDIARLDLGAQRLAVLSACSSGATPSRSGGSLLQLGTPFLLAGTHQVVVTLWPVRDEEAKEFMALFHRFHAEEGLPPARALQRAKQEAAAAARGPGVWAMYQVQTRGLTDGY